MQPSRIVVVDKLPTKLTKAPPRAQGLHRRTSGPNKGKWARVFAPGEIGRADMLSYKFALEDMGAEVHVEYMGKQYPECTMYCTSAHHPGHTQECMKRRGVKSC